MVEANDRSKGRDWISCPSQRKGFVLAAGHCSSTGIEVFDDGDGMFFSSDHRYVHTASIGCICIEHVVVGERLSLKWFCLSQAIFQWVSQQPCRLVWVLAIPKAGGTFCIQRQGQSGAQNSHPKLLCDLSIVQRCVTECPHCAVLAELKSGAAMGIEFFDQLLIILWMNNGADRLKVFGACSDHGWATNIDVFNLFIKISPSFHDLSLIHI